MRKETVTPQNPRPKIFGSLLTEVIRKDICDGCGACIASCPVSILKMGEKDEKPTMEGRCILCEYCYYQCPRVGFPLAEIEAKTLGRSRGEGEGVGVFLQAHTARAKREEVAGRGSDGGVVTSLLAYALEEGLVEAVVTSTMKPDELWRPTPTVILSARDILSSIGTKYTTSPSLVGLWSAVREYDKGSVALVGVPCQIRALRKMQQSDYAVQRLGGKVSLAVGLFCMESFWYDGLVRGYLEGVKGLDLGKLSKLNIREGKFIARVEGVEAFRVPLKDVEPYARKNCLSCGDFTSELADISVGSVGSNDGWSTVIIRTERGRRVFEEAVGKGYIEASPLGGPADNPPSEAFDKVLKLARRKRKRLSPPTPPPQTPSPPSA